MPEGDTTFRTATSLRNWLNGRIITGVTARDPRLGIERLVGLALVDLTTHGKHLFMEFHRPAGPEDHEADDRLVLRTHMMMTGSWHVYSAGDRWHRPARQVVASLTAGDRAAVCFNAPVVELLNKRRSAAQHDLGGYGPDILADPLDVDEIVKRSGALLPWTAIGVTLLDQHVVAGIGNIYRCESLFRQHMSPFAAVRIISEPNFRKLIQCAAGLMRANLSSSTAGRFSGASDRPWVYGRAGRPCRVCRSLVQSAKLGPQPRTVYWCPTCQPGPILP